jgi:glycosyltransferase involved in cell wall biosynthesis
VNKLPVVFHIITGLEAGGAEQMLFKLCNSTQGGKYRNIIISLRSPGYYGDKLSLAKIEFHCLNMSNNFHLIEGLFYLRKFILLYKPVSMIGWMYHGMLLASLIRFLYPHIGLIWNIRCSNGFSRYSLSTKIVVKLLSRLSYLPNYIIVNSISGMIYHQNLGFKAQGKEIQWKHIPNGFNTDQFSFNSNYRISVREELLLSKDVLLIGNFSRFHPMKDHELLLRSVSDINLNFVVLLVGNGMDHSNEKLRKIIENYKLERKVKLLGLRDDIPRLMASLDLYVLSSAYGEGFPNVLGEAMSCGVPCISTDVGDAGEILDGVGTIVQPGDAHNLKIAIQENLQLPLDQKPTLREKLRSRTIVKYDLRKIALQYENIIESSHS